MARCFTGPPRLPTFNLLVNIWFGGMGGIPPAGPPNLANVPCQLQLGERVTTAGPVGLQVVVFILLPPLTNCTEQRPLGAGADILECPAGSARWYQATYVDDVGKGFPNEYRQVMVAKVQPWPVPIP